MQLVVACWHDSWRVHIQMHNNKKKKNSAMREFIPDQSGCEPDVETCRTERVVNNISMCLAGDTKCRYALAATYAKAYCLHPDHKSFRIQQ